MIVIPLEDPSQRTPLEGAGRTEVGTIPYSHSPVAASNSTPDSSDG